MTELDLQRRRRMRAYKADLTLVADAIDTLNALAALLVQAHSVAADLMADGLPSGNDSEPTSGGDVGRPTEAAVAQRERLAAGMAKIHTDLRATQTAARTAFYGVSTIAGKVEGSDSQLAPGQGNCLACDRWVSGTASDRIAGGYCGTCNKKWERLGRPDRVRFQRDVLRQADEQREAEPDAV